MCLKELPISGSKQLAYYKVSGVLNSFRRQKFVKRFMWAKYGIPKYQFKSRFTRGINNFLERI